jgi:spermidine synthase
MPGLLLHLLFFASGAAGLIYEVVWVRQFGTVFGSSVYGVAIVTALFMCGLGVGGFAAGRFADARFREDPRQPLRWYGRFELAIAVLALAVALGLPQLESVSAAVASYVPDARGWYHLSPGSSLARYAIAAALLAPITLLMGGTLTLLVRTVVGRDVAAAGWRIGTLYAVNTAGAALGCLLTDLLLVPAFGIRATQGIAVSLNAAAGLGALALASAGDWGAAPRAHRPRADRLPDTLPEPASGRSALLWTGVALALTGFASMGLQVVWFRHLISVHGGYRPVFSLLLFVILMGLWAGSWAGGWCERRIGRPLLLYAGAVALFAVSALGALALFDVSQVQAHRQALFGEGGQALRSDLGWRLAVHWIVLRSALWVVGLPMLFLGAAFPLANAYVQRSEARVGDRAGALYLANTAGGVLGSLLAGFVLLPRLGTQRAALGLVAAALLSLLALQLAARPFAAAPRGAGRSRAVGFAAAWALGLAALLAWARLPSDFLLRRVFDLDDGRHRVLALHEGVNETLAILERPGVYRTLFTNGHSMSSTSVESQRYMRAFAHVPLLLHEARTAMVMCFGVGNTLSAVLLHPLERVDLVDYSEDVLEHAGYFAATNGNALRDPRVRVFVNDGRQHLRMQPPGTYDLVTGEPPPIAYAGVVNLYTREFFALARSRLRPGGLFSYWFPISQVTEDVARSLVAAFVEVFPDSVLLSGFENELILLGANGPLPSVDPQRLAEEIGADPALARDLRAVYLDRPEDFVGAFAASADTMRRASRGVQPVTDDHPALEYGGMQYARRAHLPADLFDVRDADRWCPSCFVGADAETYRSYLAIMARLYRSEDFLTRRPGDRGRPMRVDVPPDPALAAVVARSLFLRRLVGRTPRDYARAVALLQAGRFGEAAAAFEDVVILSPADARARARLGEAYLGEGRPREARTAFEEALVLAPTLPAARAGLERAAAGMPPG